MGEAILQILSFNFKFKFGMQSKNLLFRESKCKVLAKKRIYFSNNDLDI